ncbi:hypothetical protein EP7_003245 [Isosphaeraceae bacterium EP7]
MNEGDRIALLGSLSPDDRRALMDGLAARGALSPAETPEPAPAVIPGNDLTMPDLAAFVVGAAVASAHLRPQLDGGILGVTWLILGPVFVLISVTASGPFLLWIRRRVRRVSGYPKLGDLLWGMLGAPWVIFAPFAGHAHSDVSLAAIGLSWSLGLACVVALAAVVLNWSNVSPERASLTAGPPWTNRLGLFLAVAWPFQCASCLAVLSG